MKKVLALVLVLMMVVGASAMAEKIGYCSFSLAMDFPITVSKGLNAAAEARGYAVEEAVSNQDPATMVQIFESFKTKDCDLVVSFDVVQETGSEIAADMKDSGIPMISVDCYYDDAYFFGVNNQSAGESMGAGAAGFIDAMYEGKANKFVVFYDASTTEDIKKRVTSAVDYLVANGYTDGSNVDYLDCGNGDSIKAATVARDWMTSHPDETKVVFLIYTDEMAYSVNYEVVNAGRANDIIILSHNADPSFIEDVLAQKNEGKESSWIASLSYNSHLYGEQIISLAEKILNGEEVPEATFAQTTIISTDNVEEYLASLEA